MISPIYGSTDFCVQLGRGGEEREGKGESNNRSFEMRKRWGDIGLFDQESHISAGDKNQQ